MPQRADKRRFLLLSLFIAIPVDAILLTVGRTQSEDALRYFTDGASLALLAVAVIILFALIPKASDRGLKTTTILIAAGFVLQIAFSLTWMFYWHIADLGGMPDVSIGDFFYLGSYVLWMAAAVPYLRKYGNLIGRGSWFALVIFSEVAIVIVYLTTKYWYEAAQTYGYGHFATAVWVSYPVFAIACLFFIMATTLLYGYEGYGKGLLANYWFFFLVPIMLIACADIVNGFYYVLSEQSVPGRLDDVLYLGGYSVAIAASITIFKSKLIEKASATPSKEEHLMKGRSVNIVKGRGLIVEDPKSVLSFELYSRLVAMEKGNGNGRGYIISRRSPTNIKEEFGIEGSKMTWISTVPGDGAIDPTKLNLIAHAIMEFFAKSNGGIVLLDGIESIMVHNDFGKTIRMLGQVNDFVMQHKGYLIVPMNPNAFDTRERALLQRDFETMAAPTPRSREEHSQ